MKIFPLLFLALAAPAIAEPVLIDAYTAGPICEGDTVRLQNTGFIFFPRRPCNLPITEAKNMIYAERHLGDIAEAGCVGTTLKRMYLYINDEGDGEMVDPSSMARGERNIDGSVTVTKAGAVRPNDCGTRPSRIF